MRHTLAVKFAYSSRQKKYTTVQEFFHRNKIKIKHKFFHQPLVSSVKDRKNRLKGRIWRQWSFLIVSSCSIPVCLHLSGREGCTSSTNHRSTKAIRPSDNGTQMWWKLLWISTFHSPNVNVTSTNFTPFHFQGAWHIHSYWVSFGHTKIGPRCDHTLIETRSEPNDLIAFKRAL